MTTIQKLEADIAEIPGKLEGRELVGYLVIGIAVPPSGGEPVAIRSLALPHDADERDGVVEALRVAIASPID